MKLLKTIVINQPVEKVWQVAAEDFANAGKWMSGVVHSQGTDCGRVCTLQNKPDGLQAIENITRFDSDNHILEFEVFPKAKSGPGLPIVKNTVKLELHKQGAKTEVFWHSDVELKFVGKLLYPILRLGLGSAFGHLLNDLKVFVETGSVSLRKQKFDKKMGLDQSLISKPGNSGL